MTNPEQGHWLERVERVLQEAEMIIQTQASIDDAETLNKMTERINRLYAFKEGILPDKCQCGNCWGEYYDADNLLSEATDDMVDEIIRQKELLGD